MTTPTPDGRRPGPVPPGGGPRRPAQPYGHPRPGHVPPGYGRTGHPPSGYGQAGHLPPGYVEPGLPPGYGEPYVDPAGGRVLRSVLILAGIAGVVTVLVGMILMVSAPEQYGLADQRTTLPPRVQPSAAGAEQYFQAAPTAPPPQPSLPAAPPLQPSTPVRLVIPKLGVNAPIKSVGLDRRGAIEVPPVGDPNLVGWYRSGPTAGEAGPSIMLGHKDTRRGSAVFSRLHEIRNGDVIEVHRQDGLIAVFTVGGLEQAEKSVFPTQRVYGESAVPQLHLITCGGTYNHATGHYTDNVIAYATMTGTRRT
ncbi:class F sortase [Planomonospora sp. ID91781]|uniref:Peptidase C60 sortase A and B n=1 Tax=Planomonospora sphaerica TaxID=161355 RepID=A0A161LN98_9ACTN|nr:MULTISPECIES: class F sortase [Planomonospora]MBG0820628.1 class F sortase [Planomonospora sp. ID91781]GAT66366.1 peptidase C60 sortase A and B [Planomonospora sphaerica]